MAYLLFLLPVMLVLGIVLPRWIIAGILGVLFPVDVLGALDPEMLDVARYGFATALVLRSLKHSQNYSPRISSKSLAATCLLIVYSLWVLKSLFSESGRVETIVAVVGLTSVIFAICISGDRRARRPLLIGFVIGSTISSADIMLQVVGLPFLGSATTWGTRYAGLGFSSTNTAPFLALALVLTITPWLWNQLGVNHRRLSVPLRVLSASLLITGLIASGGRGGLLGLILAMCVLMLNLARKRLSLFLISILTVLPALILGRHLIAEYISRGGKSTDFSSGRQERNFDALSVFSQNLATGIPFGEGSKYSPHTPILLFGLQVGVFGALGALAVTLILFRVVMGGTKRGDSSLTLAMMASVMFVTALLEPVGFYVGLSKTTLLMVLLSAVKESWSSKKDSAQDCEFSIKQSGTPSVARFEENYSA